MLSFLFFFLFLDQLSSQFFPLCVPPFLSSATFIHSFSPLFPFLGELLPNSTTFSGSCLSMGILERGSVPSGKGTFLTACPCWCHPISVFLTWHHYHHLVAFSLAPINKLISTRTSTVVSSSSSFSLENVYVSPSWVQWYQMFPHMISLHISLNIVHSCKLQTKHFHVGFELWKMNWEGQQ